MRYVFFLALALVMIPGASRSQVTLGAHCEGDSILISVEIFNGYLETAPEDHSILVFAEYVGTCEDRFGLSHPPLPFPPYMDLASYSFRIPNPDPDRYFFYQAVGLDPGGQEFPVFGGGDVHSWDFAGCENAVLVRGTLSARPQLGGYAVDPCPESCWSTTDPDCPLDFNQAAPGWEAFADTGMILDFYGDSFTIGMPGAPCAFIHRVEPVTDPAGCGAVGTDAMSWGALKANFR